MRHARSVAVGPTLRQARATRRRGRKGIAAASQTPDGIYASLPPTLEGDVAAEGLSGNSSGSTADGEVEPLGLRRTDAVHAGDERDGEVALDAAVEGGHAQLSA